MNETGGTKRLKAYFFHLQIVTGAAKNEKRQQLFLEWKMEVDIKIKCRAKESLIN